MNAIRELPSNEYLFFGIPQAGKLSTKNNSLNGKLSPKEEPGFLVLRDSARHGEDAIGESQEVLPLELGRLAAVRIALRHARCKLSEKSLLTEQAVDANKLVLSDGVDFQWKIAGGEGALLDIEAGKCQVSSNVVEQVSVEVRALQGDHSVTDQVTVKFLGNIEEDANDTGKGLPSYRLELEHEKLWWSRYDGKHNEIIINSAHCDFVASRAIGAKHRRYIGKLYAKEVVLINFPHETSGEAMERLIQLMLRTEDVLW